MKTLEYQAYKKHILQYMTLDDLKANLEHHTPAELARDGFFDCYYAQVLDTLEDVYGDSLRSFDALQAIDLFIEQYDWDIFADVLKKYNVDSEYVESCPPEDILNNDIQVGYYKTLVDQWWR